MNTEPWQCPYNCTPKILDTVTNTFIPGSICIHYVDYATNSILHNFYEHRNPCNPDNCCEECIKTSKD